jgi:transposase InsO family protein
LIFSDPYAHKCCKTADIKSGVRHYKYKKSGEPYKVFPNLLVSEMKIDTPLQCIVSDMTAFRVKGIYYELTLYMDLWNNELVSHSLSSKRGDRMTYISGLEDLLAIKALYPQYKTVLHSDQGSVYASKNFNELLPMYNVTRSMSRENTGIRPQCSSVYASKNFNELLPMYNVTRSMSRENTGIRPQCSFFFTLQI